MRVDLNPARAGMCDTLIESDHTTIQRRLREREQQGSGIMSARSLLDRPLKPVAGLDADDLLEMTEASYIELVQWTGEQPRSDKRGQLKPLTGRWRGRNPRNRRNRLKTTASRVGKR